MTAPMDQPNARAMAVSTALHAHDEQYDLDGKPYINHVARVAACFDEDTWEHVVGWLHDVVEDSDVTLDELRDMRFPEHVVEAVDALTRRDNGESYAEYVKRVCAAGALAVDVKLVDVYDNLNPQRMRRLDGATQQRLVSKYTKALIELLRHVSRLTDVL